MKLYDNAQAPNPRRVKIFAREKGIELELRHCDLLKGEHKSPDFLQKNPSGKIPVLELDDGRCIPESVAICRYLEALYPEPNLFGRDAYELSYFEARNRQIELEFWREVGISWVHGPVVAKLGIVQQIPEAKRASDAAVMRYFTRLDQEFADNEYVAGERFSIGDISLFTGIEFAASLVGLPFDSELTNLNRWFQQIQSRPSCAVQDSN